MSVKQVYEGLRKRFPDLPDFNKLNNEFEISTIENEEFLLREIKRKISEKIQQLVELLERILSIEIKGFSDIYECKCCTSEEKGRVIEIYKALMALEYTIKEADLAQNDKVDVAAIKTAFKEWPELRQRALVFVKKLKDCWKKEVKTKEALEYLG